MGALVVSLVGFVGVFCASCALSRVALAWGDPMRRRLRVLLPSRSGTEHGWHDPIRLVRKWVHAGLDRTLRLLAVTPQGKGVGVRTLRDTVVLVGLLGLSAVSCAFLVFRGLALLSRPAAVAWLGSLVGAWLGMWLAANLWRRLRVKRWAEEISNSLIDVLDLWVLCLGSGMSFQTAMVRVTEDTELTSPALRRELQLTHQEMQAGCPREEALRHLARRCGDSPELRTLVSHVVQSERLGSGLAQTLRVHAQSLRFKRTQEAKELIQKLPVKMAFPLVFCILPSLFVVILGPALLRLFAVLSFH